MFHGWYVMYMVLAIGKHDMILKPVWFYPNLQECLTMANINAKRDKIPYSCELYNDDFFPKGINDHE